MFEVGDRVYVKKERLTGKIINVSDYRPPDMRCTDESQREEDA